MTEGKRQKQVAAVIEQELHTIFHKLGLHNLQGGLVSIGGVKVTPDLYEARIALSLYHVKNEAEVLQYIESQKSLIKKELTKQVRHQFRIMPQLTFYNDDTLAYVDKIESLLKQIDEDSKNKPTTES